jgi:serine protease Do
MKKKYFFIILFLLVLCAGILVGYSQKNKIDTIIKPVPAGYDFPNSDNPQEKPKIEDDITNSRKNAITRTVAIVSPAIVGINVTEIRTVRDPYYDDPLFRMFFGDRSYKEKVQGLGSGFIISKDGYILTNDHVAGNASKIIVTLTNGKKYDAKLIGTDAVSDIALLKIDGSDFPFVKFGNSEDVLIGEWAIAFGNPFGLFAMNDKPTVTVGVISNIGMTIRSSEDERRSYKGMIQTDAAINSGNSGGPLVNSVGEVIGINTIIYTPNQGSVGVGFAVPVNKVKEILKDLKEVGKVEREFWTGLEIQELNPQIARYFGLKKSEGVVVTEVIKGSPGDKSGIKIGDIITDINGVRITGESTVFEVIKDSKSGDFLKMKIFRENNNIDIALKLEKKR